MKGMKTDRQRRREKNESLLCVLMIVFIVHSAFHIECIIFQSDQIIYIFLFFFLHIHVVCSRKVKQ